jgi:hypothetical protein
MTLAFRVALAAAGLFVLALAGLAVWLWLSGDFGPTP